MADSQLQELYSLKYALEDEEKTLATQLRRVRADLRRVVRAIVYRIGETAEIGSFFEGDDEG